MDKKWEIPRHHLRLEATIGEGEFGKVVRATAMFENPVTRKLGEEKSAKRIFFLIFILYFVSSDPRLVAVKMLKSNHSPQEVHDLVGELMHLKEVEHPNVIRLLVSMGFTKKEEITQFSTK